VDGFPATGRWFHHVVGAVFGALVLGPYAAPDRRAARILGLGAAGAVIYHLAVRFVVDGPLGYDALTSFVLAGAGSAVLCGIAVVLIAPRAFSWPLVAVMLAAGAVGGAAFELKLASDPILLVGHATWQLLVCLALQWDLRDQPGKAAAA
jgi:hypothetical protein